MFPQEHSLKKRKQARQEKNSSSSNEVPVDFFVSLFLSPFAILPRDRKEILKKIKKKKKDQEKNEVEMRKKRDEEKEKNF